MNHFKVAHLLPVLTLAVVSFAAAQTDSRLIPPTLDPVEKGLNEAYTRSLSHDTELTQRSTDLARKMLEFSNHLPEGTKIADLNQSQRDEWNLFLAQQQYLKKSNYLEMLKRRELLQLLNLVKAFKTQDKAIETTVLYSANGSMADALTASNRALHDEFGADASEAWSQALILVDNAQQLTDAQTIPLKGLVGVIKFSKQGFSFANDRLEFLNADGFPNTSSGQVFLRRLTSGLLQHDPDAAEVSEYLKSVSQPTESATPVTPTR